MIKKLMLILVFPLTVLAEENFTVKTVDFLPQVAVNINAAGPLLVQMDTQRNCIIMANTLTSSISIIDGQTHLVKNIPIGGRIRQHLKAEAMTLNKRTGDIYIIGTNCLHIVYPDKNLSELIETGVQLESIAVDENTGNVFVTGRQSKAMFFYEVKSRNLKKIKWVDFEEPLINLNATPPPAIRKVVAASELGKVIAIDGYTSTLYLFNAKNGKLNKSRPLRLINGARWHYAGYNEMTHHLYLVVETDKRKVVQAAKIDVAKGKDVIVPLPELTEAVGVNYNPQRDEVYIPYDNYPTVHVVDFKNGGTLEEIKLPAFGNDASAIDFKNDILYIASWAHGEIDVIDLEARKLIKRIPNLGIIPHTFTIAFNPNNNLIYIPKGATAVNGSFGAAMCVLDPIRERYEKIYTGWVPIDLIELKNRNSFLVFNSEDQFAEVHPDGRFEMYDLPYDYPVQAVHNGDGDIYLSYGPHQSYWPNVYIWDAKDGILTINADDFSFYDRRLPRQAYKIVLDKNGVLYFTQNNWGSEEQFLGRLEDEIRLFEIGKRLRLGDKVMRETTQRILNYDPKLHRLYLVRVGEQEGDASILQIIDPDSQKVIQRIELGLTATDLVFDDKNLYITNFESNTVSIIDKRNFTLTERKTEKGPLKLCRVGDRVFVINHLGKSLQEITGEGKIHKLPQNWMPDNLFTWNNKIVITAHNSKVLYISLFDPETKAITLLHQENYPFGDTRFDSRNVSFYLNGQFGDVLFSITQGKADKDGRLWVTDFLSGKLFIISKE
jgi:DNA-binding beta-propeller fold protein YncE